jgi:hypothetical protein
MSSVACLYTLQGRFRSRYQMEEYDPDCASVKIAIRFKNGTAVIADIMEYDDGLCHLSFGHETRELRLPAALRLLHHRGVVRLIMNSACA